MNKTIETILAHRSVRDFEDRALSPEQIETLVKCAQAAATSSFQQAYTIIGVTDSSKKKEIAKLALNQDFVAKSGHLFIFCADLNRHEIAAEMGAVSGEVEVGLETSLASTEKFMAGLVDAALAAQNTAIAAESMGLGICYVGGIRNKLVEISDILKVPNRVVPLFGMAIGYPTKVNGQKPRLPIENIYHENEYQQDTEVFKAQLTDYNETIENYYDERTVGTRQETWTEQMVRLLSTPRRMYLQEYLHNKGIAEK